MTLQEVGDAVGVGKSTVRKWETGMIANMKRDKIAKLAEALGTTPAMILGWQPSNVDYMITDKNGNQIMVESIDPPSSQELFVTTNYKNLSIDSKSRLYEFLKKLMELDKLEGGDPK